MPFPAPVECTIAAHPPPLTAHPQPLSQRPEEDLRPRFIVFVMGGVSWSEVRCAYDLAAKQGANLFIGGNTPLVARDYIRWVSGSCSFCVGKAVVAPGACRTIVPRRILRSVRLFVLCWWDRSLFPCAAEHFCCFRWYLGRTSDSDNNFGTCPNRSVCCGCLGRCLASALLYRLTPKHERCPPVVPFGFEIVIVSDLPAPCRIVLFPLAPPPLLCSSLPLSLGTACWLA